jgi:hypothetical protein
MKVFNLKINSSVVTVNVGVILVSLIGLAVAWFTDNQALLTADLSPVQLMVVTTIYGIVNTWLRTQNTKGLKPVEVIRKDETKTDE